MVPAERLARGLKEGAERRRCRTRNRCRRKRQGIRGGRGGGGGVIVGGKGRGGWWWWCGGERGRGGKENVVRVCVCVGPGCATRFESQRSEALRLQNGVKTRWVRLCLPPSFSASSAAGFQPCHTPPYHTALGYAATKPSINSADVSWQVIFTNHETYGKRETTGCSPSSLTLRLPHPRQPPDRKTGPRLIHRNRPLFFWTRLEFYETPRRDQTASRLHVAFSSFARH